MCQHNVFWQRMKGLGFSGSSNKANQDLKFHPIRCGLIAYSFKMRYQELGVQFENSWHGILYTYHLYYILRLKDLLQGPWEDMEALIKAQPQLDLSRRGATSGLGAMQLIASDLGVSSRIYASSRISTSKTPITDERVQHIRLRERWSLTLMFKPRSCSDDGRTNFTEDDLEAVCSKAVSTNEHNKPKKGKRPTIPQLLRNLSAAMVAENTSSNFDYLEMNRLCWQLLFKLRPECDPSLKAKLGQDYLPEDHLPFITLAIQKYDLSDNFGPKAKMLWMKAGKQCEAFRRESGSTILDAEIRGGFDPANDVVEAFNAHYDRDSEHKVLLKGPGNKSDKYLAFALSVAEKEMDKYLAGNPRAPEIKRHLLAGLLQNAGMSRN